LPLTAQESAAESDVLLEGDVAAMLDAAVPNYVGGVLYFAVCQAVAAESAARRTAMDSANKNASEMIDTLTLSFNRARQAVITQEITEIVSGAEAL
jgi:F-type H+-transporting ATPase subunit gamma